MKTSENVFETREGCDVNVTVYLMRHAHKSSYKGDISEQGINDAKKLKGKFERLAGIYKTSPLGVAHSGHKRPRKTAELLTRNDVGPEASPEAKEFVGEVREGLKDVSSQAFDDAYQKLVTTGDESAGVQMVIDTGNKRFDEESASSVERSQSVAQELLRIVEQTKKYEAGTKKPIVVISHSSVVENFLVDLLGKRGNKESLKEMGGGLKFLEEVRLYINRKSPQEVELRYRFRDFEGSLTEQKLRQLAGQES